MNHDEATRYFDELGAITESRPPVLDLLTAGRNAERRKRRRTVASSVVAVALILGGGAAVQQVTAGDRESPDQVSSLPEAPDGMRFAGMGRVVVAVPEAWGSVHACAADVIAPATACTQGEESTETLSFFKLDDLDNTEIKGPVESTYNGVDVIEGPLVCPPTASCAAPMPYVVRVPSEGIGFMFGGGSGTDSLLQADVVDSVRLLPVGYTTVPYLQPGLMRSEAEDLVEAAGLDPYLKERDVDVPIADTEPAAGSVVRVASTVTLLPEPDVPPVEGTWTALLSGVTADGGFGDLHRDTTFTLTFAGGELRGDDECNSFSADYSQAGQDLTFGPIESTMIGCETTEVIVRVLNDVRHVTGSARRLYLHAHHWGIVLSLRPTSENSGSSTPRALTCPTEMRAAGSPPFFDESAPGEASPEAAVEAWLDGPLGRSFGPDYVMDDDRNHAWILRADGTAEALVTVKLTAGGGYFYYGHEACG